jgi:hypothetical protein
MPSGAGGGACAGASPAGDAASAGDESASKIPINAVCLMMVASVP